MNVRCLVFAALLATSAACQSPTVAAIRKAGVLTCGIDQSEAEFSMTDEHGSRVAFDRDLCDAVAAAILGHAHGSLLKGFPDEETALEALRQSEVDMVATVSDDFTHSTLPGIRLSQPILADYETFLLPRSLHSNRASRLSGRRICVLAESEAEVNLRAWFATHHLLFVPFPFSEEGEMEAAFVTGNCAALFGDATRLANTRAALGAQAEKYTILPNPIAPDPLASAVRSNDEVFANIVHWTYEALHLAASQHVTAQTIAALKPGANPATDHLLDTAHTLGRPLELNDFWPIQVIKAVGNYTEIYTRDLGASSPLKIPQPTSPTPSQPLPFK